MTLQKQSKSPFFQIRLILVSVVLLLGNMLSLFSFSFPFQLEAIVPVAMGKTRAKQYSLLKTSSAECKLGDKVMCVQLHGDAGFTGQGVIMEALGLSKDILQQRNRSSFLIF
jgi:hypothetical protein